MKLLKLLRPLFFVLLLLVIFGAGCYEASKTVEPDTEVKKSVSGIPMIDVTKPALISTTTEQTIEIAGTTDQEIVYILGTPIKTPNGNFSSMLVLDPGTHIVPVSVSNGFTTTTISLQITRE